MLAAKDPPKHILLLECALDYQLKRCKVATFPEHRIVDTLSYDLSTPLPTVDQVAARHGVDLPTDVQALIKNCVTQDHSYQIAAHGNTDYTVDSATGNCFRIQPSGSELLKFPQ